jgi:peptidoglycan/LPS O-acetylase OafA/YrhL
MTARSENLALTGVRGIAAIWVVLFHFCPTAAAFLHWPWPHGALTRGYLGVDLFFVLSGYVIGLSYTKAIAEGGGAGFARFWIGRAFRILPLHWFMMLAYGALVLAWPSQLSGQALTAPNFIASFLLLQSWGFGDPMAWNWPTWSLSAEMAAYVIFPALVWGVMRFPLRAGAAVAAAFVSLALFAAVLIAIDRTSLNITGRLSLVRCALEFSAGFCLTRAPLAALRPIWAETLCAAGVAIVAAAASVPALELSAPFGFTLIIAACAAPSRLARAAFANPVSVYLGRISYSIYLVHAVLLVLFEALVRVYGLHLAPAAVRYGYGAAYWPVLLAAASLTWALIERPGQAAGRRLMVKIGVQPGKNPDADNRQPALGTIRLRD